ncbi:MAG: NTP transferase domain-containing protein, partial [Patescibacteria group bacterium]
MVIGLILAAGKGTRMKSEETGKNKTSLSFNGKPIIQYGVDLLKATTDKVALLVGAYSHSIREMVKDPAVLFLEQKELLGTGQAVTTSLDQLEAQGFNPTELVVGYGDHMMFYTPERVRELLKVHKEKSAAITMVTTMYDNPNELAWGRVIRNGNGHVKKIVEHKEATAEERAFKELNAGL